MIYISGATLEQCLPEWGFQFSSIHITLELVRNWNFQPFLYLLNQKLWQWGPAIYIFNIFPGNSNACSSLRRIILGVYKHVIKKSWVRISTRHRFYRALTGEKNLQEKYFNKDEKFLWSRFKISKDLKTYKFN